MQTRKDYIRGRVKLHEFLLEAANWSDFAASLVQRKRSGLRLTQRQVEAAECMMSKCLEKAGNSVPGPANAHPSNMLIKVDLRSVPSGLYADPEGDDSRLKVFIQHGKEGTKWEGFIFVKDGAEYGVGRRYGTQVPNSGEYRGQIAPVLQRIAADPFAASTAYGRLVGRCGVCNRKLEDALSVAEGIGPVCKGKF